MKKFFLTLSVFSFVVVFLHFAITMMMTTDLFFLIDTGREIITNGFVYKNIFTLHHSVDMVVQQWLYCVYIAFLYDTFGSLGLFGSIFFIAGAIFYFTKKYINLKFHTSSNWLVLFVMVYSSLFIFNIRPEALSILLLLLQFLAVLKKKYWTLPIILLAEANFHISFVWLHWLFILPYLNKKIILPGVCSVLASLINPYFVDGLLYLPNSMIAGTFKYVDISEMKNIFLSPALLVLWGTHVGLTIYFRKNLSRSVFLTNCIIFILSALSIRNMMFLFFCSLEVFPLVYEKARNLNFSYKNYRNCSVYLIIFIIFIFIKTPLHYDFIEICKTDADFPQYSIEYLNKNADKTDIIYSDFDTGAYLQFFGFRNIYIDCRPELFMKQLNHKEDILVEYADVVTGKIPVDKFFNKYNFEYALVYNFDKNKKKYVEHNWVLVAEDSKHKLYRKAVK